METMTTKKRLLFVDDDADILRGLKRMLRPYHNEWEVVLANSGEEALQLLNESHFDCVVSDMRMPKMSGVELLTKVYEQHPQVVRFVLSGHADSKPILQAIPVTHQYLSKPCTPEQLTDAVRRALGVGGFIQNNNLRKIIGSVDSLPSRPKVYSELTRALNDENTSLEDISKIVETDVAISAKLLQVVNSAFFGLAQNMTRVRDAVTYLGISMIKSIVLSEEMYRSFKAAPHLPDFSLDAEYEISFMCAQVAKKLTPGRDESDNAFMAGVLHRTGRLVLAQYLPDDLAGILAKYKKGGRSLQDIEQEIIGTPNEYIGAYLLGLWGLPYSVVEAVAHHNAPWMVPHDNFHELDALYIASHLVADAHSHPKDAQINLQYLQQLGVADKLDAWREMTAELLEPVVQDKE